MPVQTLTLTGVNISGYSNLTFALLVAEDDSSDGNEDWDADTLVTINVSVDGTSADVIQFAAGGATNTEPGLDTDFDGVADGPMLSPTFQEFTASIPSGSTADIVITFSNLNSGDEDISIDNIRIVDGYVSTPTLVINSPSDGTEYNPEVTALDVTFTVSNFVVATAGNGDGHIHYSIDGGSTVMKYDTDPIPLTGLTPGAHSVYMELVDDAHQPLSPPVNQTVNFSIASYTDVANLADLRAGTIGQYYRVTGEIFGTYAQNYRNQKWAQDATAGILIDDVAGVISTVYNEGDGVTNLRGKLGEYNGTMQLVPSADPGAPTSTGTIITPEMVSIADLAANGEDYESELVQISEPVSFADGDGTAVFATGTIYVVNGASEAYNMRTSFYDADYIGAVIPDSPVNLAGIITERSGNAYFITPRAMGNDMNLGVNQQPIEGFGLYPNPVNNGVLSIITQDNLEKNIQIFNVLGKQVFAQTTSGSTINVSSLNSGIYIIRVEEAGRLATRKLVIE
jgi:hypothetical protein